MQSKRADMLNHFLRGFFEFNPWLWNEFVKGGGETPDLRRDSLQTASSEVVRACASSETSSCERSDSVSCCCAETACIRSVRSLSCRSCSGCMCERRGERAGSGARGRRKGGELVCKRIAVKSRWRVAAVRCRKLQEGNVKGGQKARGWEAGGEEGKEGGGAGGRERRGRRGRGSGFQWKLIGLVGATHLVQGSNAMELKTISFE